MKDLAHHRILLVNDDGIDAPGMQILEQAARQLSDDVWVIAPDKNCSGASQSLSIGTPMRIAQRDERHFALRATPTECVMLAIHEIMRDRLPTICLSGINRGPNLAEDLVYSGTIAAAREATQLGIPAIALSQVFAPGERDFTIGEDRKTHWETSQRWCAPLLLHLLQESFDAGVFLNVNFPGVLPEQVEGVKITAQGQRPPGCYVPAATVDENGQRSYHLVLAYRDGNPHPDSDLGAIASNHVSVTPLKLDMTSAAYREKLIDAMPSGLQPSLP
ncbi:MAG: 5'/3'-nucleotidase SurE [Pseudomonadota bacterium]